MVWDPAHPVGQRGWVWASSYAHETTELDESGKSEWKGKSKCGPIKRPDNSPNVTTTPSALDIINKRYAGYDVDGRAGEVRPSEAKYNEVDSGFSEGTGPKPNSTGSLLEHDIAQDAINL